MPALQARAAGARAHPRGISAGEAVLQELPDHARASLRAAGGASGIGASKQGKFWQYQDKIWNGDQEKEAPSDLERYARELKLDIPRWKRDSDAAAEKVNRDRADGEKAGIDSTPTLFINGRKFHGAPVYDELKDWVDEELNK